MSNAQNFIIENYIISRPFIVNDKDSAVGVQLKVFQFVHEIQNITTVKIKERIPQVPLSEGMVWFPIC